MKPRWIKSNTRNYNLGDYIGKSGVERKWEAALHGGDGGRQIEVDARGRFLRAVAETNPTTGNSLVLTSIQSCRSLQRKRLVIRLVLLS